VVARFEAERQALALMDHPNIARVFDGGATETGRPYFVMELVRGEPITAFCDSRRLTTPARLKLFITVCRAVQHAHQKGVIHRDLKPSNLLVIEQDGHPVPKVIDFGIARATADPLTDKTLFTRHHQFLGTPAYMSPEQASLGGGLDIDTRSDLYSLGVLLYELLTGRTALDASLPASANLESTLRTLREQDPPPPSTCISGLPAAELAGVAARHSTPPSQLGPGLRGELDWIVLKALEKDRARRYPSAHDLAADLQRFLNNEPISAAPPALGYQLAKFARRHRPLLAGVLAFLLLLLAGLIATGWQAVRATRHLKQARLHAYAAEIHLAQQALEDNNLVGAKQLLDGQRPEPGEKDDLRGFEWRHLWQLAQPTAPDTFHDGGHSQAVAFSRDGSLLAAANTNVILRETASHRIVARLPGEAGSLDFSPRTNLLAVGELNRVRLWNTETWTEMRPPLSGAGYPARFSPDGAWLVTGAPTGEDPQHRLWRTDTWEPVASCPATPELAWQLRNAVAFSPDGTLLATPWLKTTNEVCGLRLWRIPSLEPVTNLFLDHLPAWSAAFLPDGRHLLIGTFLGDVVVWDVRKREVVEVVRESNAGITSISVAAGAPVFVTTGQDHKVSLWDSATRKVVARLHGHLSSTWASALSPDGRLVATGSSDGMTRLWDSSARGMADPMGAGSLIAGFTRNSRTLVLAPREGDYRWHLFSPEHSTVEVPAEPPLRWDYIQRPYDIYGNLPVGVLGRTDGSLELWDLASGVRTAGWQADTHAITAASFSPDGTRLATGTAKGQVKVWDVPTRRELMSFEIAATPGAGGPVSRLVFSPDGRAPDDPRGPSTGLTVRMSLVRIILHGHHRHYLQGYDHDSPTNPGTSRRTARDQGGVVLQRWRDSRSRPVGWAKHASTAHPPAGRCLGWSRFGCRIASEDSALILVDTSVLVAWLDAGHAQHEACTAALEHWSGKEELAVSAVAYAELAAGARTREAVEEWLSGFRRVDLDFAAAWRAGVAFRQYRPGKGETDPVLPDFLIRAQAAVLGCRHLTNDRRRKRVWPDVDWIFPDDR
jgi:WD40 repeat protein/predicted nucleic acid-binding protein